MLLLTVVIEMQSLLIIVLWRGGVEGITTRPGHTASAEGNGTEAYDSFEGGELRKECTFVGDYLRR